MSLMQQIMMISTGTMKEEGPMSGSYNGIVEEAQTSAIFESMASLDDNNLQECFGLDIESAAKAEHAAAQELVALTNEMAMFRRDPAMLSAAAVAAATHTSIEANQPQPSTIRSNPAQLHVQAQIQAQQRQQQRQQFNESPSHQSVSSTTSSAPSTAATATSNSNNPNEDTKPKRPLSAYNLFFQLERERLIAGIAHTEFTALDVERVAIARRISDLQTDKPKRKHRKSHGKITFADLARSIANKWKILSTQQKDLLLERAALEKSRYLRELEEWTKINDADKKIDSSESVASTSNNSEDQATVVASGSTVTGTGTPDVVIVSPSERGQKQRVKTITPEESASSIPTEVNFSGMSSVPLTGTSNNSLTSMYNSQNTLQQLRESHQNGNNKFGTQRTMSSFAEMRDVHDPMITTNEANPMLQDRMIVPTSKRVRFVPNNMDSGSGFADDNVEYASSLASSIAVAEALRMARRSGMNTSSILRMFEQMAVHENDSFVGASSVPSMHHGQPNRRPSFSTMAVNTIPMQLRNPLHEHVIRKEKQKLMLRAQIQQQQQQQHHNLHLSQHQLQSQHLPLPHRFQRRMSSSMNQTLDDLAEAACSDAAAMSYEDDRQLNMLLASYEDNLKRMASSGRP